MDSSLFIIYLNLIFIYKHRYSIEVYKHITMHNTPLLLYFDGLKMFNSDIVILCMKNLIHGWLSETEKTIEKLFLWYKV